MKTKRLPYLFLSILFFLFMIARPAGGKVTLRYGTYLPKNHPWHAGMIQLGEQIASKSAAGLALEALPKSSFKHPKHVLEGIRSGKIDIGTIGTGVVSKDIKPMRIFDVPFLFRDREQADEVLSSHIGEKLLKEMEKHGFKALTFVPSGFPFIVNKLRPIKKLGDLKGLRVATRPKETEVETFTRLGAIPQPMIVPKLLMELEKGMTDGVNVPSYFLFTAKSPFPAKYITELPTYYYPGIIIMNLNKWQRITSDQKRVILKSVPITAYSVGKKYKCLRDRFIKTAGEKGIKVAQVEDIMSFKMASKAVYKHALYDVPDYWRGIAIKLGTKTFDLKVISSPKGAYVYYSRRRDPYPYFPYKESTTCTIPDLYYCKWKIKVTLKGYKPQEKLFDPFIESVYVVDFSLEK